MADTFEEPCNRTYAKCLELITEIVSLHDRILQVVLPLITQHFLTLGTGEDQALAALVNAQSVNRLTLE